VANFVALANSNGHQARKILESMVDRGESFHALTFNLSTIYELCSEKARLLKLDLAAKVAAHHHDDGYGTNWEKVNADFKV
jgi:hypothetical protein